MKLSKDFKEIKGDASFRKFYRNTKKNSVIVFANREKIKNLLIYDSINKILIKNDIIAPKLLSQDYKNNYIEIQYLGNKTIYQKFSKNKKNQYLIFKKAINVLNKIQLVKDKKIAVQGLGNVGFHAAKFLQEEDECRIICVMEHNGAILNPDGLDIEALKKYQLEHGTFEGCEQGKFEKNSSEFLSIDCDILIPAAKENVIDESNAAAIQAKLIVEAANGPITFAADEILNERNIMIIPDIMANAGGVAVSYFEWIRNLRHIRFGRLEKRRNAYQFDTLISAIETMTGKEMPEKFKNSTPDKWDI